MREGLMDDTGYHGFDYEPPCTQEKRCVHDKTYMQDGEWVFKCELEGFCEFEEYEDA